MSVTVRTHEKLVIDGVRAVTAAGLMRATVYLHAQCRQAVGVPNTGVRVSAKSVQRQADAQLGGRSRGLIKVKHTRKFKDGSTADVEAHYMFDQAEHNTVKRSVTIYPYPSKPGEPPRKRTGWGQRHVVWEFDPRTMRGRVGIAKNAIYMLYLELGTRRVKRRPWLVATLKKRLKVLGMLASTGGNRRAA